VSGVRHFVAGPAWRGYRAAGQYGEQTDTRTQRHNAFTLTGSVIAAARHPEKPLAAATLIAGGITTVSDPSGISVSCCRRETVMRCVDSF
jgi:hypothetical protein